VESDKSNWDYNFFDYLFEISKQVTQNLAVCPAGMSESDFAAYLEDIASCYDEVVHHAKYRCSNGEVFSSVHPGAMKSGWYMTIAANSIGQLALHVLTMVRMGFTDAEIYAPEYAIVVGGDDVLQTFPQKFDVVRYRATMTELGFDVSDFKIHKQFDGCEFFSNEFKVENGAWTFHPTRFTKHVAHLRATKYEDLAAALSCHMLNHVWNNRRFNFFQKMYSAFRKEDPDNFPLIFNKSQRALQYKVLGVEAIA